MNGYKEVENIFEGLSEHIVASKSLIEKPYVDMNDGVIIEGQTLHTLDDGMKWRFACGRTANAISPSGTYPSTSNFLIQKKKRIF